MPFPKTSPSIHSGRVGDTTGSGRHRITIAHGRQYTRKMVLQGGRAAAIQFRNPGEWLGKSLDVIGWQGDLHRVAAAQWS